MNLQRDDLVRTAIAWFRGQPAEWATGTVVAVRDDGDVTVRWDGAGVETVPAEQLERVE
jgi:hypothetical protein